MKRQKPAHTASPHVAFATFVRRVSFLLIVLTLTACSPYPQVTFTTPNGPVVVTVEIADTEDERAQGLMDRRELRDDWGMIFIFDDLKQRTFWMKNTLIPLDMIFVDNRGLVNEVLRNVQPCVTELCPVYPGSYPAQYVVEVNAGYASEHGIDVGAKMTLDR